MYTVFVVEHGGGMYIRSVTWVIAVTLLMVGALETFWAVLRSGPAAQA